MFNVKFDTDRNEGGQDKSDKGNSGNQGQTVLSADQLAQLIQAAVSKDTSTEQPQSQPNANDSPIHTQLGIGDDALQALTKSMGEDGARILLGVLGGIQKQSTNDSSLLLQQMDKMTNTLGEQIKESNKQLKNLGSQQVEDISRAHGLDKVFTEENAEDIGEMLDIITERNGGLYNARKAFDEAAEKGDLKSLLAFKEKFEDFTQHKYKNHQSVSGNNGTATRTDMKKSASVEAEIEKLNIEIEKHMTGPNKDFHKVIELQEKVKEKADELIN